MKKLSLAFIPATIMLMQVGCARNKCSTIDRAFVDTFNSKLDVVRRLEEADSGRIGADEYVEAIIYLGRITGIPTRGDYSSTMGYRNHKLYKSDMKKWKRWLEQNKCKFNTATADSLLHR